MKNKKFFMLFGLLSLFMWTHSQNRVTFTENFDGTVSFTANPSNSWNTDGTLYTTTPYSYHGHVPINMGDSMELITPYYNLTNYQHIMLRFSQICKVVTSDTCQIQYQENTTGAKWRTIPTSSYNGKGIYTGAVFSHASYPDWKMNDTLAIPNNSWWQQEEFDISGELAYSPSVRFRFIIKRGNVVNTNFAYGWLIDNFELIASTTPIIPPLVAFEPPLLKDTVYLTGPFEVRAKLISQSGYPMLPPKLVYTVNYNSVVTKDSILMTHVQGDTIWTATIPNQYYGTHISYSINGYDSAGNFSSAHNAFYTSRINHFTRDTIIIGTNTTIATFIQYQTITPILGEYSWSCMLYNVADYTKYGGVIKSIAWEQAPYPQGPYTYKNQKIYMYAVKATEPPSVYQDAFAKGWQLVYEDSIVFTQSGGWVNMTLSSPFYLPPGYNLYIQNENRNNDAPTNHIPFYYTSAPNTFRGASAGAMFPGYGGTISGYRTNLRLIIDPVNYDSNSVMLYSVNQPSVESVVSRDSAVIVQIKNMGIKNLSSASINWSINGVVQTPYTWNHATTGIPEGFLSDTIHIGYYNPIEAIDTLKFWVSLPNGEIDSVTADDTLRYTLNACTGMLNGEYVIGGDTGDFPTIRTAINTLYFCGMSGNVTFKISSGEYATQGYNVLLEFMEPITGMGANDTLFITSATGRAEDVIICPYTLGCGTYLKDVRNIVFTNLTFSTKNQIYNNRAVDIATGCSNIEFSHCVFDITRLTPGQTDGSAFWVPVSSAPVNGLRINYNTFLGAYDCIYIGSSNSNRTNNVEIIGNQMLNCHRSGVYNGGSYVDFKKISHNYITINPNSTVTTLSGIRVAAGRADEINNNTIIIPNTAAASRTVYGMYLATATNYIKEIKNNKIQITNATTSYAMYLTAMNVASATDTNETLIANNEVISNATGTNYGIYATTNYKTHFYHNSVYVSGGGATSRAFYEATAASTGTLKNNIMVNVGGTPTTATTYAVYFITTSANNWDINYNNYYSIGTNLAYAASANRVDLAAWKTAVPQDSNSINALPPFLNIDKNLVLREYIGFECPLLPIVTSELRGYPRDTLNYMGCYTDIHLPYNLALTRFISPSSNVLITGSPTPLTVVMENKGDSTITNAKIAWRHNGTLKKTISWTGNLAKSDTTIIYLDTINPIGGENNIQVYSYLPNGEDDEYPDNDTIVSVLYGCDSALRGTYTVGTPSSDFATLEDAIVLLKNCGMAGPVTLALADGVYGSFVFRDFDIPGSNDSTMITVTSAARNTNSVYIWYAAGDGIVLDNAKHLKIEYINIDGRSPSANSNGIVFLSSCENIEISHCHVRMNTTTTTTTIRCLSKAASTGLLNNVRIIGNIFEGGYYGVYLYAGTATTDYGTNIVIDSNIIRDQYSYATFFYYADFKSVSHNTISSRTDNTYRFWYGLRFYYCNYDRVNANKIHQRSDAITSPYLIYTAYTAYNNAIGRSLLSNNELIGYSTGAYYGIYATYSAVDVYHNSIYMRGAGATRGIYTTGNATYAMDCKNNNVVMQSSTAHPIYVAAANTYIGDYNNYYAPAYVGYSGGNRTTMSAWQTATNQDQNSISINPSFIDSSISLQMNSSIGFECPTVEEVPYTIDNFLRIGNTAMGCYGIPVKQFDAGLLSIECATLPMTTGVNTPLDLVVVNAGFDTIQTLTIDWELNGVAQTPLTWTGSLALYEQDTISMGSIIPISGNNTITAYFTNINGNTVDSNAHNDTLFYSAYACDSLLNGTYSVGGVGSDIASIEDMFVKLEECGINGPVTFAFASGIYNEEIALLSNFNGMDSNNTVTFTSLANHRDSVVFTSTGTESVFRIGEVSDFVIKNITIDATSCNRGINITAGCNNIEIRDCAILSDTTTTASTFVPIYKASGTGVMHNVKIINNLIVGGYYGIYLYAGISTTNYGTNIVVDSNTIKQQRYYATYFYYTDFNSVSYNTILSRTENTTTIWYGFRFYYCNYDRVNANKIHQLSENITSPYLIYTGYTAYNNALNRSLLSNNELIGYSTTAYYGIYTTYSAVDVYHNSVYIKGTGATRGIYTTGNASYAIDCKNNNVVMLSPTAHPVYVNTINTYTGDYNNYYAPDYVGYLGGNQVAMSDWQTATGQDSHSVSIYPTFVDSDNGLEMSLFEGLKCPLLSSVPFDINGESRTHNLMGAYTRIVSEIDAAIVDVIEDVFTTTSQHTPLYVIVQNNGTDALYSAVIDWTYNGIAQASFTWTGMLDFDEKDTVLLDSITPIFGCNELQVWISRPNDTTDMNPLNDTLLKDCIFVCDSVLSGTYIVGTNGKFSTINEAITALYHCGIKGPVTIAIDSGVYYEYITLTEPIPGSDSINTVTFTSITGNAVDVVIHNNGDGTENRGTVQLKNMANIAFSNITISGKGVAGLITYTYAKAIELVENNDNIEINACILDLPTFVPTVTSSNYTGVFNKATSGNLTNIRIINNTIRGGAYGVYIYGPSNAVRNTNILFQRNNLYDVDYCGVYSMYTDFVGIKNNTIKQRTGKHIKPQAFLGLYFSSSDADIIANKIQAANMSYLIYLFTYKGLVANNELIGDAKGANYGIYLSSNANAQIYHNSIYITGTGAARGIYFVNAKYTTEIANNNICMMTNAVDFVVYLAGVTNLSNWTFDYNNYYSLNGNIGYAEGNKIALSDWQTATNQDAHSTNLFPNYLNINASLMLMDSTSFSCPSIATVSRDINDSLRGSLTTKGAYHYKPTPYDVRLVSINSPTSIPTVGVTTPLTVTFQNMGTDTLYSVILNWSLDGLVGTPHTWGGVLPPKAMQTITMGSFMPTFGEGELVVWTSLPIGYTDGLSANDTIHLLLYGCDSALKGTYTVGSLSSNFATYEDVYNTLINCGVSGATTFLLDSGTYSEVSLYEAIKGSSVANTITFQSASGNPNDVIFLSTSIPQALMLANTAYLTFKNITFIGSNAEATIRLSGNCNDIMIDSCKIYTDTLATANTYCCIGQETGGTLKNICITNNNIVGGYYGIYLYGQSAASNENIEISNNTVYQQYYSSIYSYYTGFKSINNNLMRARAALTTYNWYGIYAYYSDGEIIDNQIYSDVSSINSYGILLNSWNRTVGRGLIANNDIYLSSDESSYGLDVRFSNADIMHNTIYLSGNQKNDKRAAFIHTTSASCTYQVKNNIFIANGGVNPYAIYIIATTCLPYYTLDYNNYYSSGNIGFVGKNIPNLTEWQDSTLQDVNSISVLPLFIDTLVNLKTDTLFDTVLRCPIVPEVTHSKEGFARSGSYSIMGAYGLPPLAIDAAMLRVLHTSITPTAGQIYPLEVVIGNTGSDTIRNATITWSFNGDTGTYYWSGTLFPISGKDTVVLDSIMFVNGNNSLSLWISNPNNLTDLNTANDTLSLLIYSCTSVLNGTYIVGNSSNADFDLAEVASILYNCGVSGPVILQMEAGIYSGLELDKVFMGVSSTNTITLTSLDRNADSVVFHDTLSALLLKDVENYAFSYITFDASSGKYGVELKGTCKNIEFYGCKIKASPTTTEETSTTSSTIGSAGVYYANTNNSSKYLDNIRFINNQIDGGSSNIFIAYMTSISSQMGTVSSVIIDSNILTNAYSQGIHSYYYGYYPSISYNTITPRASSTAAYYGISAHSYHTIPQMVANKINISGKSTSYGVYLYAYHNYSSAYGSKGAGLLANNEVIITNATGSAYGIYVYEYSQWDIYHNSIYIASNASACYALYVQNSMVVNILNNSMVVATSSPSSYALYKTNATYATYTYGVVDYNNYYSHLSSNIAYIGGDKKSVAEIQLVSLQDIHSVSVFPSYVNPVNSLALVAEDGLACPRLALVRENIEGKIRKNTTAMGAYATPLYEGVDLALTVFVEPSETNIACLPDFTPVKVALTNMGAQTVDFTTDSIVLHLSVDGIVSHQTSITLNIGKLELEQIDIIEFYSAFNISLPGMYNFTAWISSDIDTLYHNDTLRLDYYVDKTILPYDNDFTSGYIYTKQMYGSVDWVIIENNPTIASVYGTKSLYFNSALMSGRGSVSRAILRSVALQGTLQPTLEFWYAHDANNPNLLDHMMVKISTDGGETFTDLQTVYRYNSAFTTPAWEHYTIDLSAYTQGSCILIAFEAASYGGGAQSIDRIRIKGKPNVAVYLDIPQLDSFEACDLDNKEINVVIENLTSQPFDLSADSVVITITGPAPQSHTIDLSAYTVFKGFAKDTFSVFANYDFSLLGNYSITADLSAVDSNMSDNIANISVLINPDIALNTVIGVDETNCKYTGDSVYITVEVINVGNLPAVGIPVNLRINNNVVLLDTILSRLEVGDTIMYTFTQPYIVPAVTKLQPYYKVDVATELSCDANLTNNKRQILACVNYINIIDLKVDSVIKPTAISCDSGLHSIYVSLILANIGEADIASAVINVDIDSAGITVDHISETCGSIAEGMTLEYEFTQAYIVPNFSGNYSVRVYLSTIDNDIDLSNDTLTVNACAIYNDVSVNDITEVDWYVGQNQPNPAQTMTEIPYAIPSDGTVNVKIMSVSGQVLYQKEIQAIAGNHNLVVDIDFLSNGIYYYSMEYEGRIIVKKMTVNK